MSSQSPSQNLAQIPEPSGTVFNIQRFTIHDGPGIRTEVFLKGCPLRCQWCSNPESYIKKQQVGVYAASCIGTEKCGECLKACPRAELGALIVREGKVVAINRDVCDDCQKCYEVCPSAALKQWGARMTVTQVMDRVRMDRSFYQRSGGGITVSGGEALLQWEFCLELLKACKREGIHTCVESAMHVEGEVVRKVLPYTDIFITDIKHMDSAVHRRYTGVGNELILSNIISIANAHKPLIIRVPVIPGFNATQEAIGQIGDFILKELGNWPQQVQLLRYRPLGEEKYASLGFPYLMAEVKRDRSEFEAFIHELADQLSRRGIPAIAGSTNKNTSKAE